MCVNSIIATFGCYASSKKLPFHEICWLTQIEATHFKESIHNVVRAALATYLRTLNRNGTQGGRKVKRSKRMSLACEAKGTTINIRWEFVGGC